MEVDTPLTPPDHLRMKERILSEIRRLAAENGGKAPGQRFFEQETGIKRGQWRGKLWIAWSDAIAEAGLAPNEVTAELDAGRVLDCFEEACRHFQRPPTWAEWQFFARQQTDFVGVHSFRRVVGDAFGAVAALRERAVERGDTELLSILPEAAASPTTNDLAASFVVAEGWVYLLQSGVHFKVGRSDELEKRVKQISIALPERVVMVHAIRTDDPPGIEAYWHRRFASRRANGEWFKLSPDDLKAFKRRKFQ